MNEKGEKLTQLRVGDNIPNPEESTRFWRYPNEPYNRQAETA